MSPGNGNLAYERAADGKQSEAESAEIQSQADAEKKRTELKKVEIARLEKERAEHDAAKAALPGRLEAEKEKRERVIQELAAEYERSRQSRMILQTFERYHDHLRDVVAEMAEPIPEQEDVEVDVDVDDP